MALNEQENKRSISLKPLLKNWYKLTESGEIVPASSFEDLHSPTTQIARDSVGEAEISTVFLGFDHSHGRGDPVLFETMVFNGEHDGYTRRYTSKAEAEAGHEQIVAYLKEVA